MKISAYIPCFNDRATVALAIESIRAQTRPVDEIFVVDDGSTDDSPGVVTSLGVRVSTHDRNLGRGAARARAMKEAAHELVLCCDANKTLGPHFVENALHWFDDSAVAAVFGWVSQLPPINAVERWRGRHLFREEAPLLNHAALLATCGAIVRASALAAVGGFDPSLIQGEDADLGRRLLVAGCKVVSDPRLVVTSVSRNSLSKVMERYWRWNTAPHGRMTFSDYLKQIVYSFKVMAMKDLKAGDPTAAFISLLSPHWQFWMSKKP